MLGVVVGEDEAFDTGHFRKLHGLVITAVSPTAAGCQFLRRKLRVVHQQVRTAREFDEVGIHRFLMLDVGADDEGFSLAFNAEGIGSAGMILPEGGDLGRDAVDVDDVFAGPLDGEEVEVGTHVVELHGEVFLLHLDLEDLAEAVDGLVLADGEDGDLLSGDVGGAKEGEALDVVPVEVGEDDKEVLLFVSDGEEVLAQIPDAGAGIDDGDAVGVGEAELEAGGIAAEKLESRIADGDGSAGAVKFKLPKMGSLGLW